MFLNNNAEKTCLQNEILHLCNEQQRIQKVKRSPEILRRKAQKASQNTFNIFVHHLLVIFLLCLVGPLSAGTAGP
jgi:uncharacterized MAPEG superfamily protein